MPAVNSYTELAGSFIDAWGETLFDALGFMTPILGKKMLAPAQEVNGGIYHQPVILSYEAGISHAAPRGALGTAAAPYTRARAGFQPDAQVQGFQIHGRSRVTYEAIARSMSDASAKGENKKKAVKGATSAVMYSLGRALAKRAELLSLHGQRGFGVIEAVGTTPQTGIAYDGGTGSQNDVSITPATWCRFIWAMAEGSTFDIWNAALAAKLNTVVNAFLGNSQTGVVLVAVNPATPIAPVTATGRVLRFWTDTASAANVAAAQMPVGANIFAETGSPLSEMVGIDAMARNVGTLFGLNAAQYNMWAGNNVPNAGNVKISELLNQLSAPIDYGIMNQTIRAVVPSALFQQFNADEAALRRYAATDVGGAKNGFSRLTFDIFGDNKLEILGHPGQKQGLIHCYVPDELERVGSQDLSFLSRKGGELVLEGADSPDSEMRAFGQFAIYPLSPRHMLGFDGVTY